MNNKTGITIILLIFAVGYIVFDFGSEYLNQQRGQYYSEGVSVGRLYWDSQVKDTFQREKKLLYFFNNTIQELDLIEWCKENVE